MGVISHRDAFTSKYLTALIATSGNILKIVPIKYNIGDYFVTEINKQTYVFKIEGSRVLTYKENLIKSCQVLEYGTDNFMPLSAKDIRALEQLLTINNLPKVNYRSLKLFDLLGKREKRDFKAHNIEALIAEIKGHEESYSEQVQNTITFLTELHMDKIVTPVKKVKEFLDDELMVTDAQYLGSVLAASEQVDFEHKLITNKPIGPKTAWLKWILILTLVVAGIVLIYWLATSNVLSHLIPSFGAPGSSPNDIMKQYPTPEGLKAAIDAGKVNYDSLPSDIKKLVDAVQTPTIEPNP